MERKYIIFIVFLLSVFIHPASVFAAVTFRGGFENAVFTKTEGNNWYEARPGASYPDWQTRLSRVNSPVRKGSWALRAEVRPGDSYGSSGERAEVYLMYGPDGKHIVENETSGTQFYAISVYLPQDFTSPEANNSWASFQQLHGDSIYSAPPVFAIGATDTYYVQMTSGDLDVYDKNGPHRIRYPIGNLQRGKWVDFVWKIKFAKTSTGTVEVWRRIDGEAGFTQVLSIFNIPTLQFKSSVQNGAILDAYWRTGYYTSEEAFTRVIYLDSHTRGDTFDEVVAAAFPAISSSTPIPTRTPTPTVTTIITVSPGESIQSKCLNVVKAGDTCTVNPGTYNEALTLKVSGTVTAPITLKCVTEKTCTINSGVNPTLITGKHIDYYAIDGFRLITTGSNPNDLGKNTAWSDSKDAVNNGNNGFIVKNNYIEGGIQIYGHNNVIENNELNGMKVSRTAISDQYAASHDNTYKNNTIHDFTGRGIWTMSYTNNIIIDGNNIYNIGKLNPDGSYVSGYEGNAIDCDGAGHPVYRCYVKNNTIRNTGEIGLFMENSFNSELTNNTVECPVDFAIFIKNYGLASDWTSDGEYRNVNTNSTITNNTVCASVKNGIWAHGSPGWTATGNTIRTTAAAGSYPAVSLADYEGYPSNNWKFQNNSITTSSTSMRYTGTIIGLISDFNQFGANAIFRTNTTSKTIAQWQALGYDLNSTFGNISPSKPGDANGDNKVDGIDYVIWLNHYNQSVTGASNGDFNNSGKVDGVDYGMWVNGYGK